MHLLPGPVLRAEFPSACVCCTPLFVLCTIQSKYTIACASHALSADGLEKNAHDTEQHDIYGLWMFFKIEQTVP